jgi:hypothetical protein
VLIEISQEINFILFYLKALLEKLFQACYFSSKEYFRKYNFQNTIFSFIQTYASYFAKDIFPK